MTPPARTVYSIRTERLLLRCWSPEDAPELRAALDANDAHLRPWVPWMKDEPKPVEETMEWLRQQRANFDRDEGYRFGVFAADGGRAVLGEASLFKRVGPGAREVGYWIDVRHARNGFATEVAAAMVRLAFEFERVERVEAHCAAENTASVAVARRLGFAHEATLPRRLSESDGSVQALSLWTMFADGFPGSPAAAHTMEPFDALGVNLAP